MVEIVSIVALLVVIDAFVLRFVKPWLKKRPVKGAFVRPR